MFNDKFSKNNIGYDLENRTAIFAEKVIELLRKLPQDAVNSRLIVQCAASAGAIGANYCEANEAESKKDFIHKVKIAKKEIKETKHWLRLLAKANNERLEEFKINWREAHELLLIFAKIVRSSESK